MLGLPKRYFILGAGGKLERFPRVRMGQSSVDIQNAWDPSPASRHNSEGVCSELVTNDSSHHQRQTHVEAPRCSVTCRF